MIKTLASLLFALSTAQPPQFLPAVTSRPMTTAPPPTTSTTLPPIITTTQAAVQTTTTTTAAPVTTAPINVPQVPQVPQAPLGAYGQSCRAPASDSICMNTLATASSETPGFTKCEKDFDCCLCKSVQCGNFMQGCTMFSAGTNGVFGVKDISIQGKADGAYINCIGLDSCSETEMIATNIKDIDAAGTNGLKNAKITVTDPLPNFSLNCIGMGGCDGLQLEVIIPGPPPGFICNPAAKEIVRFNKLSCVGEHSCKNMDLTIRNNGCNSIQIEMLECLETNACIGTNFNLIGDVELNNCDLRQAATATTTGIENCFSNLQRLICPDPTSCRDAVRTLVNPMNGFGLNCQSLGSCQGSQFTIEIDSNSYLRGPVTYFDSFKFGEEASGAGATIIINNNQGIILNIQRIECSVLNSCAGTTFIIGKDVSIGEIICNTGTCRGCQIKIDALSPGIPCDPNEIASFLPPLTANQNINSGNTAVGGQYIPMQ